MHWPVAFTLHASASDASDWAPLSRCSLSRTPCDASPPADCDRPTDAYRHAKVTACLPACGGSVASKHTIDDAFRIREVCAPTVGTSSSGKNSARGSLAARVEFTLSPAQRLLEGSRTHGRAPPSQRGSSRWRAFQHDCARAVQVAGARQPLRLWQYRAGKRRPVDESGIQSGSSTEARRPSSSKKLPPPLSPVAPPRSREELAREHDGRMLERF